MIYGVCLDYRVIGCRLEMSMDYMEYDEFDELYMKILKLCDEYNVHLSSATRTADILPYEKVE